MVITSFHGNSAVTSEVSLVVKAEMCLCFCTNLEFSHLVEKLFVFTHEQEFQPRNKALSFPSEILATMKCFTSSHFPSDI